MFCVEEQDTIYPYNYLLNVRYISSRSMMVVLHDGFFTRKENGMCAK